ncbi:MAG: hypothetical protein QF847_00165 [Candidatus Marinimicrobia bacterium]|jgi:hypothetical protein|nr:hypothetical protein [Candidatus Neomarinimicrobiota bacterium]MDP6725646.1 hypothetical protein [Candidatus Neomarinimicrobiota bacterium]|tara:strand:- start:30858 stop:31331 length:474 start_codon:yes stop_codon:yes gene_type:complete
MKKYLLIIFSISVVFGQDTDFETQYNYNTIYLQQGFITGQKYVKGGESFPLRSLRKEMDQYQESSDLYDKSFMMRLLGLAALTIGPVASSALVNTDESSFISVYLGSLFLGVFASYESYNKLHEAIWIYNRESLKANVGTEGDFQQNGNWKWQKIDP